MITIVIDMLYACIYKCRTEHQVYYSSCSFCFNVTCVM